MPPPNCTAKRWMPRHEDTVAPREGHWPPHTQAPQPGRAADDERPDRVQVERIVKYIIYYMNFNLCKSCAQRVDQAACGIPRVLGGAEPRHRQAVQMVPGQAELVERPGTGECRQGRVAPAGEGEDEVWVRAVAEPRDQRVGLDLEPFLTADGNGGRGLRHKWVTLDCAAQQQRRTRRVHCGDQAHRPCGRVATVRHEPQQPKGVGEPNETKSGGGKPPTQHFTHETANSPVWMTLLASRGAATFGRSATAAGRS